MNEIGIFQTLRYPAVVVDPWEFRAFTRSTHIH